MAASAILGVVRLGWETRSSIVAVALIFAVGGFLAFAPALFAKRLVARGRPTEIRFAAGMLAFGIVTIGVTAAIYALYYRDYYADWHAATFSIEWAFQFAFTFVGALYQFAVIGLRLYFPLGFVALVALSLWLARKPR